MQFWRGNDPDAGFEAEPETVARQYTAAVRRDPELIIAGRDKQWAVKLSWWTLDKALRDWMTHPKGFNASWAPDDQGYGRILALAGEMLIEGDPDA